MDNKIFLEGKRNKRSVNVSGALNVGIEGRRRLLPTNDLHEVVSEYGQYVEERKACTKVRVTCQVNTLCSNVLFNRVTEIVKDEGSPKMSFINYKILNGGTSDASVGEVVLKDDSLDFWGGYDMKYNMSDKGVNKHNVESDIKSMSSYDVSELEQAYNADSDLTINTADTVSHPTNSIRDTQLSNLGYVYHCGLDFFNNHLVRSTSFKGVTTMVGEPKYDAFNTIFDLMRDLDGKKVVEKYSCPISSNIENEAYDKTRFISLHLYEYDDAMTFDESVKKRLINRYDGWCGFYNKANVLTYKDFYKDVPLELDKPLMYMNGGDFVDMYPDRTLYTAVPKYNKYRDRIEKNWNYCITYPSSSVTNFADIIEENDGINALKALMFDENTVNDNGVKQLVVYGISKHGLKVGDFVNVYKTYEDEDKNVVSEVVLWDAEVLNVVDDYIFTVFGGDVSISSNWVEADKVDSSYVKARNGKWFTKNGKRYYVTESKWVNLDDKAQNLSYKKTVGGVECEYYVRIFSKLPNFKYADCDTHSEYEIYKDGAKAIDKYQAHEYEFENQLGRMAFAKNVYGDDIAEIVFTDDIDIANLMDNRGRPLTSLYLTFIKNNKGYKEWYGYNYDNWTETEALDDNVEFSHCFGGITCGFELSDDYMDVNFDNQNVKAVNLIHGNLMGYRQSCINQTRESYSTKASLTDNEIWYEVDKHFYGDLVCYDEYNAVETSIQPIMHRFNTAQRESSMSASKDHFKTFLYDEIAKDDYDSYFLSEHAAYSGISNPYSVACNSLNEGYYYKPHHELRIRTFGKLESVFPTFLTMKSLVNSGDKAIISCLDKHYLTIGDKAVLYDMEGKKYYDCVVSVGPSNTDSTFTCKIYDDRGKVARIPDLTPNYRKSVSEDEYKPSMDLYNYKLFKMDNIDAPKYAEVLKDGSCRIIWRDVEQNGLGYDKTVEEYPFTNGAIYVNSRVDLYLRRQDPYGLHYLKSSDDKEGNITKEEKIDTYIKEGDIAC